MADPVSWIVDLIASNPMASLLLAFLLLFVFGAYMFVRKTVKEFTKGLKGS